jgi:hypothetical protein
LIGAARRRFAELTGPKTVDPIFELIRECEEAMSASDASCETFADLDNKTDFPRGGRVDRRAAASLPVR